MTGRRWREWQATGHDAHSQVADPLFFAPQRGDFGLRPGSPAPALGFHPIDLAGVGGGAGNAMHRKPSASPHPISPKRRRLRRVFWGLLAVLGLGGVSIFLNVHSYGRLTCPSVAAAPTRPVAIVFGAVSIVVTDRVATGVELYKAGKVRKLLLTGDNSRDGYNEPEAMKQEALALGVPARDIVCDYAGFRTYDSLYRARDVFGVRSAILVTQGYHLPRALFLGRRLGLDVVGVDAAKRAYGGQLGFDLREIAATEVAWIQATLTHPRPKFLGKPEPMFVRGEAAPHVRGPAGPRCSPTSLRHVGTNARPARQRP